MNNIITIITPSYNQGQFIEETIQSVLSQEGDFFIDYIIADGGSTDKSVEIIEKYDTLLKTKRYPIKCKGVEYRWWSHKDKGQTYAINKGLKIAKGDILSWINSDDFYEPGAFAYILEKFKKNPHVDLVYGDCYFINQRGGKKILRKSKQETLESLLTQDYSIYQPAAFFTKRIIQKIGFLDQNLHYAMDYDLWIRILQQGKGLYLPKVLSNFRVGEHSKTGLQQKARVHTKKNTGKQSSEVAIADEASKIYSFDGTIRDLEYLVLKHERLFEKYRRTYGVFLRRLGTKYVTAGNKIKSRKCFSQSIKVDPGIRNIITFLLSLSGRKLYLTLLHLKMRIAGERDLYEV
ncbi:glycosyltransferase [Patescibacteria group bacterium AH-259-L07]|nr:glycosyltransferase [Patescibacteria group bacterium AH-259-L07]